MLFCHESHECHKLAHTLIRSVSEIRGSFYIVLQRMKLLSYILAFYLVLLSAVPCCAFDKCGNEEKEQQGSHQKDDTDCGNCSPFFSCEGCAPATIAGEPLSVEIPAIQIPSVYTSYIEASLPRIDYEFWQPPRIG
jgi:hypothetical protein